MEVKTVTGATSYQDIQVQVDAQKLIFKVSTPNTVNQGITQATVNLEIKNGGNSYRICKDMPLVTLMEFAQQKEGFIWSLTDGTTTNFIGMVDLADDGAIPLNQHNYLQVELKNCNAAETFTIAVKNSNQTTNHYFEYDNQRIPQGQVKMNLVCRGKEYLLLSRSADLSEVRLAYQTGRQEQLLAWELDACGNDDNDISKILIDVPNNKTTAQYGPWLLHQISLTTSDGEANVITAEISTSGNAYTYYLVDIKQID